MTKIYFNHQAAYAAQGITLCFMNGLSCGKS